ncbi:MAG: hypothetical protein DRO98_07195 [Archaeoglobales archaeon]|nr:MAG: hypothetical protein DRO98_07195 [Archaeoglobales archaeon]
MIHLAVLLGLVLLFALALEHIFGLLENAGFDKIDAFAILILPPAVEFIIHPIHVATYDDLNIYADIAGFVVPLFISAKLIASGRVPALKAVIGIALLAYVCNKNAVVGHFGVGITDLVTPIIVASLYSLYASDRPAPLAYVSGSVGMIIGADILNIPRLSAFNSKFITVGGAGMFDAIYIVGIFAVFLDILISWTSRFKESFKKLT